MGVAPPPADAVDRANVRPDQARAEEGWLAEAPSSGVLRAGEPARAAEADAGGAVDMRADDAGAGGDPVDVRAGAAADVRAGAAGAPDAAELRACDADPDDPEPARADESAPEDPRGNDASNVIGPRPAASVALGPRPTEF